MNAPPQQRYEVDVAACRPSQAARPIKPVHVELLMRSIREIGLLQPIVVRAVEGGFEVEAGLHRLEAFKALGRATVPAIVRDDDDLRAELALIDENLIRNDYSPAERASAIVRRKAIYETLHPETKHGGDRRAEKSSRQIGDLKDDGAHRFTEETAKAVGQSERTIQRAAARGEAIGEAALAKVVRTSLDKGEELDALAKLAEQAPDKCAALIERAAAGEKVSAKVEVKKVKRAAREAELGARQQALPQRKFGVIYADPEWKWKPWSDAGMDRGVENTYPTSETTDIAARDVLSIAADDCVLVLWARADMLPEALYVMAAWGFRYVAQRVWRKEHMSTGFWVRYDHELVLIGSRGHPVAPAMGTQERSVFEGDPAVPGLNSSKPECVAEWIERSWPNTPKIELNRRGPPRPGWSAWGNEAETSDPIAAIGEPEAAPHFDPLPAGGEREPSCASGEAGEGHLSPGGGKDTPLPDPPPQGGRENQAPRRPGNDEGEGQGGASKDEIGPAPALVDGGHLVAGVLRRDATSGGESADEWETLDLPPFLRRDADKSALVTGESSARGERERCGADAAAGSSGAGCPAAAPVHQTTDAGAAMTDPVPEGGAP